MIGNTVSNHSALEAQGSDVQGLRVLEARQSYVRPCLEAKFDSMMVDVVNNRITQETGLQTTYERVS